MTDRLRALIKVAITLSGAASPRLFSSEGEMTEIENEILTSLMREGVTMGEAVRRLSEQYGRSASVPDFSEKLRRGSLRRREAKELADALVYEIVWKKRGENYGESSSAVAGRR